MSVCNAAPTTTTTKMFYMSRLFEQNQNSFLMRGAAPTLMSGVPSPQIRVDMVVVGTLRSRPMQNLETLETGMNQNASSAVLAWILRDVRHLHSRLAWTFGPLTEGDNRGGKSQRIWCLD